MSNPFLSATESWAKEREDLDAAEAAAADGYTSNVSVPVLNGGIAEMRARTAYGDELKKRKEFAASFSSASDFDENTGSFSVDSNQMTPANRVKLSNLGGSYSGSDNPFAPSARGGGKERVSFGEFTYQPDEETQRQRIQDFSTRTKWHRDFLSENIVPRLSRRIGPDQSITWMDPEKAGQENYKGDRIRLGDVLPELNSTKYDNPSDDKSRAKFDAILDGVYNQAGYLGLLPKSYDTGLKDNEAVAALDALGAPRWADGTGMWRNREQSNALRERWDEGAKLAKSSLDQVNYIFNTEAGWKLLGDSSWGRTGWSWGNALSTFGWDKENQESYQKELNKSRKELDGYSIADLREYFEQAAEMDAADLTNPKARERLDYFTGLVQKRYNDMVEDRTWMGVLVDASARAATDEFVLNSWSTVRGIAGLFDSDYERDKDFWDRFAIHSEQNQTYSPEYKGDNWLLGGMQSAVELGVQQGKMAMVGLAGAGIGKGIAAAKNIREFGAAGKKIADMTDKLTGLQRLERYADYGMRTGQWLSIGALNEADVAGQMAREYMARGLDPSEVGTGEKLALTAWYTGLDGMFNPFIKGMRTRVPGMRGMVGPDPTKILPPIWAGKGNMLKTVGNWIKAVGKDTAFEVGQEAAQQVGSNVWSAGRFGTFGMKSQKHSEVREDGTTDWDSLWKNYKEQSIDIFWGTVFGAGGGAYGRARAEMQHDADIIKKLEAVPVREFARQGVELSDVKNLSVGDRLNLYEALRNHSAATAVKLKLGVAEAAGERGSELANSLQDQLRQLQTNNAALYNRASSAGKHFLQRLNERTSGSAQVEFGGDNAQLRQGRENNRDSYQLDLGQLQASRDEQVEARKKLDKRGDKGPLVWGEPDGTDSPTQMRFVEEHDEDGNITEINIQNNKDVREPGGRPLTISRLEGETNDEVIGRALELAQELANYHADLSLIDQDTAAFAQQFLKNLGVGNARVAFYSSTEDLTARIQEARKQQIEDGVPEDQLVTPSAVYNDLVDQDGKVRMDVGGAEFGNTVFIRRGANQTVGEMVATLAHEGAHVEIFNEAASLAQDGEAVRRLCEITGEDPGRVERFISDLENLGEQDRIFVLRGMLVGTDGAYEIAGMLARGREKMTAADKKKFDEFKAEAMSREETLAYTEQVEWNNPEANAHLPGTKWYQRAMTTIRHPMRAKQYYDFKSKYPTMDRVTQAVLSRFIGGGEVDADTAMNFIGALHQREGKDTDRAPQILMGAMGRPSRAYTATESLSMLVGSNLSRMTDFERGQLMSAMVRVNSLTKGEDGLDRAEALNRVIKELIAAGGHNAVVNEMLNQLQDESVLSPVALTQFVDASRAVEKYRNAGGDQLSKNQKIGNIDVGVIGNKEKIKPIETKKGETEATAPTAEPAPTATEEAPAPQESVPAPVITTNPSETPTGSSGSETPNNSTATPAAPATETPAPAEAPAPKGKRRMGKAKKPPETTATPAATEAPATTPEAPASTPEAAPQEAAAAPTLAEPEPTATPVVEIPAKVQTAIKGAASRATGSFKVETASAMLREAQKNGADALSAAEDALREFAEGNGLTAKFSDVEVTDSKTKKKVSLRSVEFVPQKSSTTQDQIVASEQDEARAALEAGADARLSDAFNAGGEKLASEKDKIMAEADALGLDVEFVDRRSPRNESIIISPVAKFSEKGANEVTQRKFEGDTSPVITDSRKDELRRVLDSGETRDGIELVATEEGLFERQKRMGRQRIGKIGEGGVVQGPVDPNDKVELGSNATPRIVPEEERRAPKLVRGIARVLNLKDISKMEIKLIPADLQKKFAAAVKKTHRRRLSRKGEVNTALDAMLMDAEDKGNIDAIKDEIRALAMKNGSAVSFRQYLEDGKLYTAVSVYPRRGITTGQHKGGWLKRSEVNRWLAEAYERGPEALLRAKEAIADVAAEKGWEVEFLGAGEDGRFEAREAIFHPQGTSGVPSKYVAKDDVPRRKLSEDEISHLRDYYKRNREDAYLGESSTIDFIESIGDKESLAKAREGLEVPKKKSLAKKTQAAKKSEEAPAPAPAPEKPNGNRRMGPAKKEAEEKPVTPAPEPAPAKAPEKKAKAKAAEKPAPATVKRGMLTATEKNTLRAFAAKGLDNLTDDEKGEYVRINSKNMKEADAVYKAAKAALERSGKEPEAPTVKPAESKVSAKEARAIVPKRVDTAKALPQSVIDGAETARSNIEYNDEAVKELNTRQKWDRFWRAGAKEIGAGAESTVAEDKAYDLVNAISGYNNAISVASDATKPAEERSAARENIQKFRKAVEKVVGKDVASDIFAGKDVKSSLDGLMKMWDETAEKQGVSGIRRTTEKGSRRAMIGGKTNARERQEAKMRRRMGKRFTSDEATEFRKLLGIKFVNLSEKQTARLNELEKKSPTDAMAIRDGGKSWIELKLERLEASRATTEEAPADTAADVLDSIEDEDLRANLVAERAKLSPEDQESFNAMFAEDPKQAERYLAEAKGKLGIADEVTEEREEKPKRRIGKKITGAEELKGVEKYRMMFEELSNDANPDVRNNAASIVAARIEDEISERELGWKAVPQGMREFLAELQDKKTPQQAEAIEARDAAFLSDLKAPGDRTLADLLIQHRTRGETARENTSGTVIDDIKSPAALAALIPQLERAAANSLLAKKTKKAQKALAALPKGAATYARLLDQAKRKWRTITGESSWSEARANKLGYETDIGTVKSGGLSNGELWLIGAAANRQAEANAGRHMLEDVAVNKRGARGIGAVGEDARDADDYEVRQGFQQSAESELVGRRAARPNGRQHQAGVEYPDAGAEIQGFQQSAESFSVQAERLLKKRRPDVDARAVVNGIKRLFETPKERKISLHWFVRGGLALPEDSYKVADALSVAEKAKVDPFQYKSPDELLLAHKEFKPTARPIDPATVQELSDARDEGDGIVSYLVQDDRQGQAAMRRIIDTHWGEDANPWCLLAKTVSSGVTDEAEMYNRWLEANRQRLDAMNIPVDEFGAPRYEDVYERETGRSPFRAGPKDLERAWTFWQDYSALPKRVAFKDGRLLAFMATSDTRLFDAWSQFNQDEKIGQVDFSQSIADVFGDAFPAWLENDGIVPDDRKGEALRAFEEALSAKNELEGAYLSSPDIPLTSELKKRIIQATREALFSSPSEEWWDRKDESHMDLDWARGGMQQSVDSEQAAKRTRADDRADAKAASFRERFPLMAVHGLSISSLKSALDAGAFVMPSTAVALKEEGWTQAGFVNKTAPGTDSEVDDFYADPSEEDYKRYLEGSAFVLMPKAAIQNRGELYTGDAFTPTINTLLRRAANLGLADEEALSDESIERVRRRFDRGDIEPVNIESTRQRLVDRKKEDDEMAAFEEAYGAAYDELYTEEEPEEDNRFTHNPELDHFDEGKIWRRMPIGEATAVIIDKAAADYDRSLPNGVIAQLENAGVKVVEVDTNDKDAVVRAEQENAEFFQSAASEAESKRKPGRTLADDGRWIFGMRKKDINERIKERGDEHFVIGTRDGHRKMSMDEAFALAEMKTPEERKEIVKRAVDAANHGRDCFLTAEETPVLMAAVVAAEINHSRAFDEWQKAIASGDEDVARSAEGAALVAHAEMNELISALSNVKGSAGRALNIHKAALFDDLSFAGIAGDLLDAKRKAEKDDEKRKSVTLTPEELKRCKERADEFAKYYDILRELEKAYGEEQAEKALLSLLREPRKRRLGKTYPAVDKAVQDAKDRVAVLEKRAPIDLADWEGTYGAIQELVRDIGDSILNEFKKDNPLKHMEVGAFLDRLKTECDKAFGHLTASDGSRGPLTAEEYRDLFTDADQFGKHPPAPENPVKAEIKRMLNATHMIYELEAVKKDPKQFPIDRYNKDHGTSLTEDDVDTEIERLKREHDDALRASGLSNGGQDAKTMPLDLEKMRTQNRIDELRRAIQNNERIVRETRQPLLGDDELAAMKRELAELQNDYAVMVSDSMTDAEKIARLESMYEKRLESSTRELERLEGGGSFNTTRMSADGKHYLADTPKMAELKKQIAANQKKIRELQMAKRPEYEMDRYAAMRILETERRIKYAEEKAENYRNGVNPAERTRRIDQSWRMRPEAQKVLKDLRDAQKQLAKDRDEFFWKASKGPVKAYNGAMALVDMHRTIRASGDISGLGIQLAPYLLMHPEFLFKGGREAIKSMFKPKHYEKIRTAIESDPRLYMVMDVMGVKLTDIGASTRGGEREDVFRRRAAAGVFGDWSERNLGLLHKAGKAYLEGSERGFNAPIVMARWEMATTLLDVLSEKFGGQDKIPQSDLKTAGRFINALTGKGDLFNNDGWLKGFLWAPGRLAGQIQAFTLPLSIAMGTTPASKELKRYIAREYYGKPLAHAAKIAAALWLASMLLKGDDDDDWFIEPDPRKPQFGKMKIGSRYFSLFGGEEAVIHLAAKAGSPLWGKRNFYGNEPKENRGNKNDDLLDTLTQFARGRVNPAVSALLTAQRGSTYTGEKIDFNRSGHLLDDNGWMHWLVFDNILPLSWTDVGEVVWDGLGMGDAPADAKSYAGVIPLAALALAGFQGQDYGDTAYRRYEAKFDEFADKVKDSSWMTIDEKRELARQPSNTPFVSYPGKFERLKKLRSIIKDGTTILRSGKETAPKGKESKRVPLTTEEHDYARKQLEKFQAEFVDLIESDRRR